MTQTAKLMSDRDASQTQKFAYNDINASVTTDGFLAPMVGRKITQTISTTTVLNDTTTISFFEDSGSTLLYTYKIIYTDATQATWLSAERTA
jgi:hypothetical protein